MRPTELTKLLALASLGCFTIANSEAATTNQWTARWEGLTNITHRAQERTIKYAKTNYPQYFIEVPLTKRTQFNLFSPGQEHELGRRFWSVNITNAIPGSLARAQQRLTNTASGVVSAALPLLQCTNMPAFEFRMISDSNFNARCYFGGKILVNAGVLPVVQNDDEFAFVIAHEMAHALARHAGETASWEIARTKGFQFASFINDWAAESRLQKKSVELVLQGLNVASILTVSLPHDRLQESEADHLGLILMTRAGYRPQAAVDLWRRMAEVQTNTASLLSKAIAKYCSSHPPDAERLANLKLWLTETASNRQNAAPLGDSSQNGNDQK